MSSWGSFGGGGGGNNAQPFGEYQDLLQNRAFSPNPSNPNQVDMGGGITRTTIGRSMGNPFGGVDYFGSTPPAQRGVTGSEQVQGAMLGAYQNLVDANQQNYDNRSNANMAYLDGSNQAAEDVRQSGQRSGNALLEVGDQLSQTGRDMYAERQQQVDDNIANFDNLSAAQASSIAAGRIAGNRSRRSQMAAGAKMGDPTAIAGLQQMELDEEASAAQTAISLSSQYNNALAQMNTQGQNTMNQAGGIQANYDQMASGMSQAGQAMMHNADSMAANMEAQGLSNYAQMVAGNPFNPVSFLPTLMAFFQFEQTPGSDSFSGFNEDMLFT